MIKNTNIPIPQLLKSEQRALRRRKRRFAPKGGTLGGVSQKLTATRGLRGTARRIARLNQRLKGLGFLT